MEVFSLSSTCNNTKLSNKLTSYPFRQKYIIKQQKFLLAPTYILTALKKHTHSPSTDKRSIRHLSYIFFLFSSCVYIFDNELNFLPLYKPLDYPGVHPPLFRPALVFIFCFFPRSAGEVDKCSFLLLFFVREFFWEKYKLIPWSKVVSG